MKTLPHASFTKTSNSDDALTGLPYVGIQRRNNQQEMLMTIEYTGRQTTLTAKLKAQAEAGIQRIDRVTNRCTKAHIILTEEKHRRIAEVSVQCRDNVLVATCEATEMESALRSALSKVEQQAIHHKERHATVRDHAKPLSIVTATV